MGWLTGTYTGWLFKQAVGRVAWSSKSNLEIIATGTIELSFFGGLVFGLLLLSGQPAQWLAIASVVVILGFYVGYKHILHDLRAAQANPLL
jgi:hypothetical protein